MRGDKLTRMMISAVLGVASCAAASTVARWDGATADWTSASDWSTSPYYPNNGTPAGTNYQAVIDAPGTYTLTLSSDATIASLVLNGTGATFQQNGTLDASKVDVNNGTYNLHGTLKNATLNVAGGTFSSSRGTLDSITLGSDLSLGDIRLANAFNAYGHAISLHRLILDNLYTLSGMTIHCSGICPFYTDKPAPLTFSSDTTIDGSAYIFALGLTNQGMILADNPNHAVQIDTKTFVNTGTLRASGGIMSTNDSGGNTINFGIMEAEAGSDIDTGGLVMGDGSKLNLLLGGDPTLPLIFVGEDLDLSSLNDYLNITMEPGAEFTGPYEIIHYYGGLIGTFDHLSPGLVVDYSHPGAIYVTAVPEPASIFELLVVSGLFVGRPRRDRLDS